MILSVKDLAFKYPGRSVLQDIAFDVAPGECWAVLGINGAGKSTLLKCLNRILKPQKGVVYIRENEVLKLSNLELAQKMGYVSQHQERNRITVFDAILLGRRPHIKWDASKHDRQVVRQVMEMLDLEDYAMRYLDELSGGELQKVVIARALAQNPRYILLDEPFTGVDPIAVADLQDIVRELKERGLGVLITDHSVRETLAITDRAYIMYSGKILVSGEAEAIASDEMARKFYLGDRFNM